jgi:hypothetical protein
MSGERWNVVHIAEQQVTVLRPSLAGCWSQALRRDSSERRELAPIRVRSMSRLYYAQVYSIDIRSISYGEL